MIKFKVESQVLDDYQSNKIIDFGPKPRLLQKRFYTEESKAGLL